MTFIILHESATLLPFPRQAQSGGRLLTAALKFHRLPDLLLEALVREAAAWPGCDPEEALTHALTARLKPHPIDLEKARGILLLGPSGAGKSAVAAKIAYAATLAGRQVEIACANDGLALFRTGTHPAGRLTVMEAEGFNPVNARARSAFAALSDIEGVESIGVVSSLGDAEDVSELVTALRFRRVIVTGLDCTRRLGATAAAALCGARLAHVTEGPREDDPLETLTPGMLARLPAGRGLNQRRRLLPPLPRLSIANGPAPIPTMISKPPQMAMSRAKMPKSAQRAGPSGMCQKSCSVTAATMVRPNSSTAPWRV